MGNAKHKSWESIPLWPHQKEAIKIARKYIKESRLQAGFHKACLIRMPTGTGKSGVIAILSRCFRDTSNILVVTPWVTLREQLARDIETRFWEKIKTNPLPWPKDIQQFLPSSLTKQLEKSKPSDTIFLCTIQTLQTVFKDQPNLYEELRNRISLVIIDEGHREPAPEWAKAVRELQKPTVLFTATPYRNDHKMFNINDKYVYVFTHQNATDSMFIREVRFHERNFVREPGNFVKELLEFYHGEYTKLKPSAIDKPRVIIRCNTRDEVNEIAKSLKRKGEKVLAFHESFSDNEEDILQKSVPNPEEKEELFWVHQNKLIEGVDDPRFSLLAIYQPLRNGRALIQQIGRIVRNPTKQKGQIACVFSHPEDRQEAYWKGYKKYEQIFNEHREKYEPRQIFDTIIQVQPEYQYFDGDFRRRFDFEMEPGELHKHLAYQRSVNIYQSGKNLSLAELSANIQKEWNEKDRDIRKVEIPNDSTYVHVYQIYFNSQLIFRHALVEYKIGFTIIHKKENYVFFYDSERGFSDYLNTNAKRIPPTDLEYLFSGDGTRINQITLMNSDLGQHTVRRRILNAYSLSDTAPGLVDHAHFFSTAHGYTRHKAVFTRRYVGFSRSRVSDPSPSRIEYAAYIQWLDTIAKTLKQRATDTLPLFDRYAKYTQPPKDPTPTNILLDLNTALDDFEFISAEENKDEGKSTQLILDEKCYPVELNKFNCSINSEEYEVEVNYESKNSKYWLKSEKLEKAFVKRNPLTSEKEENLISYLNRMQSFRIVPATNKIIYAHSHFYEPRLPLLGRRSDKRFDLLKIFHPDEKLAEANSEKGKKCPDEQNWQKGCLFYLIDHINENTGISETTFSPDYLVCDDIGANPEIADFIAVSKKEPRVVLIHAKAFEKAKLSSATAFHDVCSQAIKNLSWLHPFSTNDETNANKWDKEWKGGEIGVVHSRIRKGEIDGKKLWTELNNLIRNPSSKKEVWLVMGKGFSLGHFKELIEDTNKTTPEIIQIMFLLQSTWGAVSSVGATLRVFCSP